MVKLRCGRLLSANRMAIPQALEQLTIESPPAKTAAKSSSAKDYSLLWSPWHQSISMLTFNLLIFRSRAFSNLIAPLSMFRVAWCAWYSTSVISGLWKGTGEWFRTHSAQRLSLTCSITSVEIRRNMSLTSTKDRSIFSSSVWRAISWRSLFRSFASFSKSFAISTKAWF